MIASTVRSGNSNNIKLCKIQERAHFLYAYMHKPENIHDISKNLFIKCFDEKLNLDASFCTGKEMIVSGEWRTMTLTFACVWNCLWGHALRRSPGINCKSRVSYPGPGFLSSATWPSLPKKRYNGLNQTKANICLKSTGRGIPTIKQKLGSLLSKLEVLEVLQYLFLFAKMSLKAFTCTGFVNTWSDT